MEGLDRLERAMQYLRTEVDAEMPAQQVVILLTVCKEEGITQHALGERLGMPFARLRNRAGQPPPYWRAG